MRVRVVQQALDAGFTVEDLARVLEQRDAGGAPCREVFRIARTRLDELDERIADCRRFATTSGESSMNGRHGSPSRHAGRRAGLLDDLGTARRCSLATPAPVAFRSGARLTEAFLAPIEVRLSGQVSQAEPALDDRRAAALDVLTQARCGSPS